MVVTTELRDSAASVQRKNREHDVRYRALARNMIADIQALSVPGTRAGDARDHLARCQRSRSPAGGRLESLRQHASQPNLAQTQAANLSLMSSSNAFSSSSKALPSNRQSIFRKSAPAFVELPPMVNISSVESSASPTRELTTGKSVTMSVMERERTESVDLDETFDLREAHFTASTSIRRVTRKSLAKVPNEAVSVMTRDQSVTAERAKNEDQRRLCNILRTAGEGCLLRGWRLELDTEGKLEVDWEDYVQAAKRLNYSGDPENLFNDKDHTLLLKSLSPADFELVDGFMTWVLETFEGPPAFFKAVATEGGSHEVSKDDFCTFCRQRGFKADKVDIEDVFHFLDSNDYGDIKWEDCICLETDTRVRAQQLYKVKVGHMMHWKQEAAAEYIAYKKGLAEEEHKVSSKHRLAPRPWMADTFERMPAVDAFCKQQRQIDTILKERAAKKDFIDHLVKNFGNEVRAIRRVLSTDGYTFNQTQLRGYVSKLRLPIQPVDLWAALDTAKSGRITIEELTVKNALILASFQQWARKDPDLGNCAAIWQTDEAEAIARRRTGTWYQGKKMMNGVFMETVMQLGWPMADDEKARTVLMSSLDSMDGGYISQSDLQWLDKWRPVEWIYAEPDAGAWTHLKAMLAERYNHPLRAWRAVLDQDDSNSIDWCEFKKACQKLHFKGNIAGAWRTLDVELAGKISLKQYDLPSATLLYSFKEWAEATFGGISACFKMLDSDASGSLSFNEMRRAASKFNWDGDVRLLFDCLDIDRVHDARSGGKRTISLNEISFIDAWTPEFTKEEIERQRQMKQKKEPPKKKPLALPSKRQNAILERLTGGPPAETKTPESMPISPKNKLFPHLSTRPRALTGPEKAAAKSPVSALKSPLGDSKGFKAMGRTMSGSSLLGKSLSGALSIGNGPRTTFDDDRE